MPVVGSAEIVVRAVTKQVKEQISKALRDALPAVRLEGVEAGKQYSAGFKQGLDLSGPIKNQLRLARLESAKGGAQAGEDFSRGFSNGSRGAGSSVESETTRTMQRVDQIATRGGGRAGGNSGNAFERAIRGKFGDSVNAASQAMTALVATGNIVGAALGAAVSGVSALASGLFALVAAAGQAAGALAVLPGIMSAVLQAAGTIKLAFGGIGTALSAGSKAASGAAGSAGKAAVSNANAVKNAEEALKNARKAAADANLAALKALKTAQERYKDSVVAVATAEKQLSDARKQATEDLQQLGFSAEEAALAEQRAGLSLQDAYKKMVAAQSLPVGSKARVEAELSYKEAELAYREAKDHNADLQAQEADAAKAGVEGQQNVLDAKDNVASATKNQADAAQAIKDAEKALADTRAKGAQQIAAAQRALAQAMKGVGGATAGAAGAASAYQTALDKLSPAARNFVVYLVSLKDNIAKLRAAAGAELFPKLETGLKSIVTGIFPLLQTQLKTTGGLVGQFGLDFANSISKGEGLKNIGTALKGNNEILAVFTQTTRTGSSTVGNLGLMLTRLLVAIQPITLRFANFIKQMIATKTAANTANGGVSSLEKFFKRAGDTAAQLGRIFGNLFQAVRSLGSAAKPAGQSLLDSFEAATEKFNKFLDAPGKKADLVKYFKDAAENLKDIGDLAVTIGGTFSSLGDNRGVGGLAKSLEPAVKILGQIFDQGTTAAPALGNVATQAAKIVLAFSKSDGIEKFLTVLGKILGFFAKIVSSPIGGFIIGIIGSIAAFTRVIALVLIPLKFFGKALLGEPVKAARGYYAVRDAIKTIKTEGVVAGLKKMMTSSDQTKTALQRQIVTDQEKTKVLRALALQADKTALALDRVKVAGAPGPGAAASPVRQAAAEPVRTAAAEPVVRSSGAVPPIIGGPAAAAGERNAGRLTKAAGGLKKGLAGLSAGLLGISLPIAAAIAGIILLVIFFKKLYDKSPEFKKFVDGIVDKLKEMGAFFGKIVNDYVFPAMNAFFKVVNDLIPKIGPIIKKAFDVIISAAGAVIGFVKDHWPLLILLFLGPVAYIVTQIIIHFKDIKNGISNAISFVIDFVKKNWPLMLAILTGPVGLAVLFIVKNFDKIKSGISNAINFVINFVKAHWPLLLAILTGPIGLAVLLIVKNFDNIKAAFQTVLNFVTGIVNGIKAKFNEFRDKVVEVFTTIVQREITGFKVIVQTVLDKVTSVIDGVKTKFNQFRDKIVEVFNTVITREVTGFKRIVQEIASKVTSVIDGAKTKFNELRGKIVEVFNTVIRREITGFKRIVQEIADKVGAVINSAKTKFNEFRDKLVEVQGWVRTRVDKIKSIFGEIASAVGSAFSGLGGKAKEGINAFIDFLNNKFLSKLNAVTSKFGLKIPDIQRLAEGGRVEGVGGPKQDNVRALLSANEYVLPVRLAQQIGYENLDRARRTGDLSPIMTKKKGLVDPFHAGGIHIPGLDTIKNLIEQGVGKVLYGTVKGAETLMGKSGFSRGNDLQGMMFGIMDKLADAAKSWGKDRDDEIKKKQDQQGGGTYNGPPGGWTYPLTRRVPITQYPNRGHNPSWAVDLGAPSGTGVLSASAGKIVTRRSLGNTSYGNYIEVAHANGVKTLYAHLQSFAVALGAAVKTGQLIGYSDSTGHSTGPHLHFEYKPSSDTIAAMRARGVRLAQGGVARATPGGILSVIAEAGKNERVEPLDRDGMSKRDRIMLELVRAAANNGNAAGGNNFNVYPSPGMNEAELAALVSRRVSWTRTVGT